MNRNTRAMILLSGMVSICCLATIPPLPTNKEIKAMFATSNAYERVDDHLLTMALHRNEYSEEEISRVCHQFFTNAVTLVSCDHDEDPSFYKRSSTEYGRKLLQSLFEGTCVYSNRDALNLYADCVGSVTLFSTNGLMADVHAATQSDKVFAKAHPELHYPDNQPYFAELKAKWGSKLIHNRLAKRHRDQLVTGFLIAVREHRKLLPESEWAAFYSNMVERAKLTPVEQGWMRWRP